MIPKIRIKKTGGDFRKVDGGVNLDMLATFSLIQVGCIENILQSLKFFPLLRIMLCQSISHSTKSLFPLVRIEEV